MLDAANENSPVTVIILDNAAVAMTGGQPSAGEGRIEQICIGVGVKPEHVRTVIPLPKNHDEMVRVIKEEIEYDGLSVIIAQRECIQTLVARKKRMRKKK